MPQNLHYTCNKLHIIFRIVRAFLIEEQKIVYKVMKAQQASAKTKKTEK